MTLLEQIMGAVADVQGDEELNAVRFRHTDTWNDGTRCRFSVQDPSLTDHGTRLAQRLTGTVEVLDVRLVKVHPADPPPGEGASLPWDGGLLTLVSWSQVSDFTGQAVGVARLTR